MKFCRAPRPLLGRHFGSQQICVHAHKNLCDLRQATCVGHFGGFADVVQTDARFAFPIPDSLASENVAPLLCGGITVFSPLRYFGVKPTDRVGVIGIGGLGHMVLQFAKAWGFEVTAFSSSADKKIEAQSFGATHFISNTDVDAMKKAAESLGFIISTVNVDLDWPRYINCLRANGTLCFVGISPSNLNIPVYTFKTYFQRLVDSSD